MRQHSRKELNMINKYFYPFYSQYETIWFFILKKSDLFHKSKNLYKILIVAELFESYTTVVAHIR